MAGNFGPELENSSRGWGSLYSMVVKIQMSALDLNSGWPEGNS